MRPLLACIPFLFPGIVNAQTFGDADQSIFGSVVDRGAERGDVEMDEEFLEWRYGGRVEVGYQARTGNTERTDLNSRLVLGMERGDWGHALDARVNGSSSDQETLEERYFVSTKSEYTFSENNYFFAAVNAEKDRIRNIDLQTTEAVGYGRRLLTSESYQWDAEIGVGGRQIRFRDATPTGRDKIVRLATQYHWALNDKANLSQDIRIESGLEEPRRVFGESITSISATLVGELALNISYTVRAIEDPDVVQENKVDTITSVGLNYKF